MKHVKGYKIKGNRVFYDSICKQKGREKKLKYMDMDMDA